MEAEEIKKQVMNHYAELRRDVRIDQKYPEMDVNDGKKHILFVQCLLERIGFYRTYLPYLMLNDTETHSAIITTIQKRDFTKSFEDYEVFLAKDLILWADYIVFPKLLFACRNLFGSILEVNPTVKIVMDIESPTFDEIEERKGNANKKLIDSQLLQNLKYTHTITCSSVQLRDNLKAQFEASFEGHNKRFTCLPTFLVSSYLKRRIDEEVELSNSIRIGLQEGNFNQETIDTIAQIAVLEKKEVNLCVYGRNKGELNYPENLKVEFIQPVAFLDYFNSIEKLNLDFIILFGFNPNSEIAKAIFQYGELALLSIPIMCDNQNQSKQFINPTVNGFVVTKTNTLEMQLQAIFKDRSLIRNAGKAAQDIALKHLSWNPERASQLINIY
jgi:hypothetical protein